MVLIAKLKIAVLLIISVELTSAHMYAQGPSCQVNQALQSRSVTPPVGLACQKTIGCFAYIECAFGETIKNSHKGDLDWHEHLVLTMSAILEQLPRPNPNPNLAEYYREFFAIISLSDPTSDRICTEANIQVRHFSPMLRMLQSDGLRAGSLTGNQESLVENARIQYSRSKCYDRNVLDVAMASQEAQGEEVQQLIATVNELISINHQQTQQKNSAPQKPSPNSSYRKQK